MTGNQLKILALITMTIDHVGVVLLPQYLILRIIGRITYPIFAYMIAEGCFYTSSKKRYLGAIFALDVICQLGFFIATGSLEQCILTSFTLAIITIYALQLADERRGAVGALAIAGVLALDVFAGIVLPHLLSSHDFSLDYGFAGIFLPVFCYMPRIIAKRALDRSRLHLMLAFCVLGIVLVAMPMNDWLHHIQWFSLLSIVPLACYNGRRGSWPLKYLFYIYYPAHLVAIWGIDMLLSSGPGM